MSPEMSLLTVVVSLLVTGLIFWPRSGIFWKLYRGLRSTTRVLIEDALKHLYEQEYKGEKCTLASLSGKLEITGDAAADLLARLESMGLVTSKGEGFELTPEGRTYALKMVRIHRLWERYLADKTGVAETEWHAQAEVLEHKMTEQEAEALAAEVGHPRYDPHGDPIPTRTGTVPPRKGKPVTDLEVGDIARIVHIEDEPAAVYAQLVAQGLHPGMQVQVVEKSTERILLAADGEECVLAPVVAGNITVEPIPREQKIEGPFETLADLDVGEKGEVIGISRACRGPQRRRLMDLGIIPGTIVTAEMRSAGGDPIAYNIRGATIALRKEQASLIHIKRLKEVSKDGHN